MSRLGSKHRALLAAAEAALDRGEPGAAVAPLRQALRAAPADQMLLAALGQALIASGQAAAAVEPLARWAAAAPRNPDAAFGLAVAYQQAGASETEAAYRAVLALDRTYVPALTNLGVWLSDRRPAEALEPLRLALRLRPGEAEIAYNLGRAERLAGDPAAAVVSLERALSRAPRLAAARHQLALARLDMGEPAAALAAAEAARADGHPAAAAWITIGVCRRALGDPAGAEAAFRAALAVEPDAIDAAIGLAGCRLSLRDREGAAPFYARRWQRPDFARLRARVAAPTWDGSPLDGMLVVLAEQGLGDLFHMTRLLAAARARVGQLVLAVPNRLVALMRGVAGADAVVSEAEATTLSPAAACGVMDLPFCLALNLAEIPAVPPWLQPEPARQEAWRQRLAPEGQPLIGIAFATALKGGKDVPVAAFAALARVGRLILLGPERIDPALPILTPSLDADGAFLDTAAIIPLCRAVVSVDTAVAHLAGALGHPTALLLPPVPEWRWFGGDTPTTPWYPAHRVFRRASTAGQAEPWEAVIERVAAWLGDTG
ncbi:MAG: hypothetical protein SF002_15635 [Alphaproteobacteria bacterium]|nr:hypothetical protein [Alphaproteobacteria bacterium]